jgi:phage shock protein PspC (stress-responsive transcriptional regulator)
MLGGVCGGLAHYFDVDPVLMRLAWVALTLLGVGITIPGYIVMWIIVPKEGEAERSRAELWRQNAGELADEARRLGADVRQAAGPPSAATNVPAEATPPEPDAGLPPSEPLPPAAPAPLGGRPELERQRRRQTWAGLVLIALGLWLLANNLKLLWWLRGDLLWPLALLGVGAWLLYRQTAGRQR